MTFMPRMTTQIRHIEPIRPLQVRRLGGVIADLWHARGQGGGGGFYVSPDPRVVVFLDDQPGAMRMRHDPSGRWQSGVRALYVPPGMPLWSEIGEAQDFVHLDLHFETGALARRIGSDAPLALPQFHGASDRIQPLARLLADEVATPRRPDMMMDALLTALLAEVLDLKNEPEPQKGGLPPVTLRRLAAHVRTNLHRQIGVGELAEMAGLSVSWFQRAFKASTDETPQRWMTGIRLQAARDLMQKADLRLAEIAMEAGFADQAHLTRTFRATYGQTPAQWRRGQIASDRSNGACLIQADREILS
ncbi:Bacillibactin transport regulator [Marinibacterium anthonyi]|nr:Bacillibactin transport regulator [Marinibacterium anthonyi]